MSALDFHLRAGSPCIDTGTNLLALINSDYDGRLRPQDGHGDGIGTFDMGAYEFDFSRTRAAFITVQQTPSGLSVEWNDNGKGMKLQRASALTNPVWQDVAGSELVNRLTLPLEGPTEFFRLYSF